MADDAASLESCLSYSKGVWSRWLRPRHSANEDIELASGQQVQPPERHFLTGFPSLAAFMSCNPNCESFIFKRFDRLAARNLLYLQGELACLDEQLTYFDEKDKTGPCDIEARECARSWEDFERIKEQSEKQRKRWDLVMKIREKLREYRETPHSSRPAVR